MLPQCPSCFPYTTLFRSPRLLRRPRSSASMSVSCSTESLAFSRATEPEKTSRAGIVGVLDCCVAEVLVPIVPCDVRSEEHTSELQSHSDLVCRLLLEKKN